jgi:methionine-rich copper-binding protein CopC
VLTVPMKKASVRAGKYRLTYRVVSKDGHVINGAISFTYKP